MTPRLFTHRPRILGVVLAIAGLAVAGCGPSETAGPEALAAARARWRAAGAPDYDLEWIARGGEPEGQFLVYARRGAVREVRRVGDDGVERPVPPGEAGKYGVEGLFSIVEAAADDPSARVEYDSRHGLPTRLRAREGRERLDVVRFDDTPALGRVPPLPPRSVPAGSPVAYDKRGDGAERTGPVAAGSGPASAQSAGPGGGVQP